MSLASKRCRPCEGGVPPLTAAEAERLHAEVPAWTLAGQRLRRRFTFPDFAAAMAFVNRMAALAEAEGHHPDFTVHYRQVDVELWTHAVGGLSENDFILAAKIDQLES
ncbi:MAG TPA: 4a-hydroxytetrahydrobiopterin dehydratase [Candidatus Limnocylindria bacterium]|nr:4a-hydroxytetrahydrobiopterin dehydratase [Candidatus Limnocylindria bacterium]